MERSKPPKDVLGLGQHLVRELGFEDSVDTLGRWMAHHVAELMDKAKNGPTKTERLTGGKDAVATILKIWKHRAFLPGVSYPLAKYPIPYRYLAPGVGSKSPVRVRVSRRTERLSISTE